MLIDEEGNSTIVEARGHECINSLIGSDMFDAVRISGDAVVYVDDIGLPKELQANLVASILATEARRVPTVFVGKALVCGVDENGGDADVPDWVVAWKFKIDLETSVAEDN
jgi:hypothetical protein